MLLLSGCAFFFPNLTTDSSGGSSDAVVSVALTAPTQTRTVAEGTLVTLEWTVYLTPVEGATLQALVEKRPSRVQTVLFEGGALVEGTQSGSTQWDTTGYAAGLYVIRLQVVRNGNVIEEARATGEITIDGRPTFEFTMPTADATLELNRALEISWVAQDAEAVATAVIGLDPDTNFESGNEITLTSFTLPATETEDFLEWRGEDSDGNAIDPNTYHLFAAITDATSGDRIIDPNIRITIAEAADPNAPDDPNDPNTLAAIGIRLPDANTEFQTYGDPLTIEYGTGQDVEALVDLRIDTDASSSNGNETTILLQSLQNEPNGIGSFDWDGTDSSAVAVPDGIYELTVAVSQASGDPATASSSNLIFLRTALTPVASREVLRRANVDWDVAEPDTDLPIRRQAAGAYDSTYARGVIFGGQAEGAALADCWFWQDNDWTAGPAGPSARFATALAHDATAQRTVLFGGINFGGTRNNETWLLSESAWTQAAPGLSPAARDGHAMVYDAARDQIVLFGGQTVGGLNNETWTWNGTTWVQKSPATSPTARRDMQMAYDSVNQEVVLFGGQTAGGYNGQTWIWNGDDWSQAAPTTSPTARSNYAMAFSSLRASTVLYGGSNGTIAYDDTWEWDGADWTPVENNPTGAARQQMACFFDSSANRVVIVGGAVGVPLVGVLTPSSDQTVNPGNTLSITWRDADPSGAANIRVVYDDDDTPAEGTETDEDEVEILSTRDAFGDGVLDTFNWLVPQITPDTYPEQYYIFVYVEYYDETAAAMREQVSVSGGRFIVPDPN